jgi:hypothetical protein
LFSYGFRPFFLLGSLYSGLTILVCLPAFYGYLRLGTSFAPGDWHVRVMLFGYAACGSRNKPAFARPRRGLLGSRIYRLSASYGPVLCRRTN